MPFNLERFMQQKHRIAGSLFPKYSLRLDQVNNNALYLQWLRQNKNIRMFPGRVPFYNHIQSEWFNNEPIDYLEFGVFKGESIALWADINRHPSSRFYGFDSFEGLPENWDRSAPAGAFNLNGLTPDIPDERVKFIKGWFQDSLPGFLETFVPKSRLVVHNDSDLHSSTIYVLTKLDDLLVAGSIVIFDEFGSALHEFRAWHDYLRAYRRKAKAIAGTGIDDEEIRTAWTLLRAYRRKAKAIPDTSFHDEEVRMAFILE